MAAMDADAAPSLPRSKKRSSSPTPVPGGGTGSAGLSRPASRGAPPTGSATGREGGRGLLIRPSSIRSAADGAPPWLPPPEGGGGRGSAMRTRAAADGAPPWLPPPPRSPSFHHRHPNYEGDGCPTTSAPSSRGRLAAADARSLGREDGHHRRREQGRGRRAMVQGRKGGWGR
jgi:hypothetical protein